MAGAAASRASGEPSPILIIEDSSDDMEAVERAFRKSGIPNEIRHVWTGEEALDFLRNVANPKPCLILLDLNMPGIGGRKALEIIKNDRELLNIPLVVLTTSNYESDVEMCYALGANTYIQKPVGFEALCYSIQNVAEYWLGTALLPPLRSLREEGAELRREKEAAEKASRVKSEFLASMSHELRTPLNSIIGMTRLLYEDASLGDEHRMMVGVVHRSAGGLLVIVNDILDLSKVESGMMELENIPFSLEEVMHNVTDTMSPLCTEKGLALVCNFSGKGMPYLAGDPTRLSRIMINLLGNAVKYTEKGTVTVDVTLERKAREASLIWSVTDTGIGIPEDKIDRIFNRFAQADDSVTRKFGGTGLGLTISRQIVERMGGAIGVESAVGKGSRFWFRVPFPIAEIAPGTDRTPFRRKSVSRLPASQRKKAADAAVLVAEDHPLNRAFMTKLLTRMGIGKFDFAEDGQAVIEAFKKGGYDLVMLDCHMPVKSGYETIAEIRGLEAGRDKTLPVVAMTADAMAGTRERCLASGMNDYLSKPIDTEELKLVLSQWITFPGDTDADTVKAPAALVDLSSLRRFVTSEDELTQLLGTFIAQVDEAIRELEDNSKEQESNAWIAAASRIRSSAAIIHAENLQLLAKRAEGMKKTTLQERASLLAQMRPVWEEVRSALGKA